MIKLNILLKTLSVITLNLLLIILQTMNHVTVEEHYHKTELVMVSIFLKIVLITVKVGFNKQAWDQKKLFVFTRIHCNQVGKCSKH